MARYREDIRQGGHVKPADWKLTPLDRGYVLKYPTSYEENDQGTVTELEPRQQGNFPDQARFPAIKGEDGSCGCLMTSWKDTGDIRLETIWQPLWDTQVLEQKGPLSVQHYFFQNPNGRPTIETNVPTAGHLTWPKRFHLWEVVIQFGSGHPAQFVEGRKEKLKEFFLSLMENHSYLGVRIGEKDHFKMPLEMMYSPSPGQYRAALCTPLYFPPVQNFSVWIEYKGGNDPALQHKARVILNGYLHREIP